MPGTRIRIDIWDDAPASLREGRLRKSHTLQLGQCLNEADKARVLQALCNFGRTLELWLEGKGEISNGKGNEYARF